MADTLNPAQEDRATFLGAPPPEEMQKQVQQAAPAQVPVPEAPPPAPKVSPYMVGLATSLGLTSEEAQGFGSDAELSRALTLAAKFRAAPPAPAQPAPPPPTDEWAEIPELDERYDPGLVELAKRTKANDRYWKKRFEDLEKQLPEIVHKTHAQMTAAQQVTQLIGDAMQETGYDRTTLTPELRQRIADMGHALYQSASKSGQRPDEKLIVKAVLPLVMGQPSSQPPAPRQPLPEAQNTSVSAAIEAQRAAIAAQRERDDKGRFLPGAPTHRASESNGVSSALRANLLDLGADPGEAPVNGDRDFFLK